MCGACDSVGGHLRLNREIVVNLLKMCNFRLTCKSFTVSTTSFFCVLLLQDGWTEPHRQAADKQTRVAHETGGCVSRLGAGVDVSWGDPCPGGQFLAASSHEEEVRASWGLFYKETNPLTGAPP